MTGKLPSLGNTGLGATKPQCTVSPALTPTEGRNAAVSPETAVSALALHRVTLQKTPSTAGRLGMDSYSPPEGSSSKNTVGDSAEGNAGLQKTG